jgi:hypothetical protein
MEKVLIRHFQVEVERQCQFAMIALQDMEEASANSDGKLFWYSVQNLLVAVGRVSRLLWPPDPLFPSRGSELRESLGVGEDSPLKALKFVEHFDHLDKRLETWYVTSEQRRFFDSYTESRSTFSPTPRPWTASAATTPRTTLSSSRGRPTSSLPSPAPWRNCKAGRKQRCRNLVSILTLETY